MERYRIVNKLSFGDYMAAAVIQLCKPALQIGYLAVAFLLSWLLTGITDDTFAVTPSVLFYTLSLFVAMQLFAVVLISSVLKRNNDMVFKSLEYQYTEITDESVIEAYASNASEVKWEKFKRIVEFGHHIFLYAEKNKFVILPKRMLPDGCAQLLQRVAANLKDKPADTGAGRSTEEVPAEEGDIHIELTSQDFFAYQLYHTYIFRKTILICSALMLLLTAVMYTVSVIIDENLHPDVPLIMLAVMLLFPILLVYISSRRKEEKKSTVRLRDNGVELDNPFGKVLIKWEKLYSARQTDRHYFLYLSAVQAVVLPKRCLDAGAAQRINDAINQYSLYKKKNRA